ncbi:SAV0927 family protein [Priestia megaterium]|uniref:SAV0927 family protein n=1 Tax=Priestia megaterium TaxID=1404 RepID=UPI00372D2E1D
MLEEKETPIVYYYCIATDDCRYDFSIIYSNMFCGKAMVIFIQTGNMALLCSDDMEDEEIQIEKLGIKIVDIIKCKTFLQLVLQQI